MLPCNHNFCQQCIQKIIDNKALAIKNSRNGGKRFKCPACRREVVIDMHGVHALPRNLVVEQLIEKIDQWQADLKKGKIPQKKRKQRPVKAYIRPKCKVKSHENQQLNIYCRTCQGTLSSTRLE